MKQKTNSQKNFLGAVILTVLFGICLLSVPNVSNAAEYMPLATLKYKRLSKYFYPIVSFVNLPNGDLVYAGYRDNGTDVRSSQRRLIWARKQTATLTEVAGKEAIEIRRDGEENVSSFVYNDQLYENAWGVEDVAGTLVYRKNASGYSTSSYSIMLGTGDKGITNLSTYCPSAASLSDLSGVGQIIGYGGNFYLNCTGDAKTVVFDSNGTFVKQVAGAGNLIAEAACSGDTLTVTAEPARVSTTSQQTTYLTYKSKEMSKAECSGGNIYYIGYSPALGVYKNGTALTIDTTKFSIIDGLAYWPGLSGRRAECETGKSYKKPAGNAVITEVVSYNGRLGLVMSKIVKKDKKKVKRNYIMVLK